MTTKTAGFIVSRGFRGSTLYLVTMERLSRFWRWTTDRAQAIRFESHAAALAVADKAAQEYAADCAVVDPTGTLLQPKAARRDTSPAIPGCLRYTFGHEYVVTLTRDGETRIRLHTNDRASALKEAADCTNPTTPAYVWQRVGKGWRRLGDV